jgi:hypothetical protein
MILNPRRKAKRKKRRKMTAKQLKFFGPRKGKRKKARKKKAKVIVISANPKGAKVAKRKRRHHRKHRKVFTHNPKRTHRRRFRRNPRSIEAGFVNNTLLPAAIGAAGAVAADMLINYLPIPAQFKQGSLLPVFKIASALLVGWAVGAVSSRAAGEEAAAGGVIVTLYGLSKGFMFSQAGGSMSRYTPMRRYAPMRGMGQNRFILPPGALRRPGGGGNMRGMGYNNPARIGPGVPSRANMRYLASR